MKYRCTICGHIYDEEKEGIRFEDLPDNWKCPTCKQPKSRFEAMPDEPKKWAAEHVIGIAGDAPDKIKDGLRAMFEGECSEVGMYLAMSRAAIREGYPEVGQFYEQAAMDEAVHAAKFAELLGECVSASTKENLEARVEAEYGATAGRVDLAAEAKELGLDDISGIVLDIGKDEARHGKGFQGLLERYFG